MFFYADVLLRGFPCADMIEKIESCIRAISKAKGRKAPSQETSYKNYSMIAEFYSRVIFLVRGTFDALVILFVVNV